MDNIKQVLLNRGYTEQQAIVLSNDLSKLDDSLVPCLEKWLNNGQEMDFVQYSFSIKGLMDKYDLKYPAALLSIDWVIRDPEHAIPLINKGIR